MESDRLSPAVQLLQAISPDPDRPDNEILTYPSLAQAATANRPFEEVLIRTYYAAENESAEQLAAAHKLAEYELIETAAALQAAQSPAAQRKLSLQFTTASVDLFGRPDATAATYLLEQLLTELCVLQTNYNVDAKLLDELLQAYDDVLRHSDAPHEYSLPFDESRAGEAAQHLGNYLRQLYPKAFAVFDGDPLRSIDATEIVELFERALEALKERDIFWAQWRVLVTDDSCLSVNPLTKRLVVGSHRASVELGELKGLFGHEVLVHALRASNGQHLSNEFEQGLPGYIAAEEGFACFVEHALSGQPPRKMYDRYLDVALALGTIDGRPHTRQELFRLVHARNIIRAQVAGKTERPSNIRRESWAHVNRIFRGTLGNEIVGVFTKDIAYYHGYQKMTAFIIDELDAGTEPDELWSLMTLGKYDPTDVWHMLELARSA
ncbi:MAG TPA: tyrosine/phenylalanine carboxypeptidase domain-containing protein [Candidatus Saccharimonadales bacterium]|nr:tyrosine/phenylalanine carboxypeptidase domain-containing protein [Candidatus Saccharimonadales bacterium]